MATQTPEESVRSSLERAGTALSAATSVELDEEMGARLLRAATALNAVQWQIRRTPPGLAPKNTLVEINNGLVGFCSELEAMASDRNGTRVERANDHIDAALRNAGSLIALRDSDDASGFVEASERFRDSTEERIRRLRALLDTLTAEGVRVQEELSQQDAAIKGQAARVDSTIQAFQTQFSQEQSDRNGAVLKDRQAQQDRFNTLFDEQKGAFEIFHTESKATFDDRLRKADDLLGKAGQDLIEKARQALAEVERQKEEVVRLAGLIADTGLSAGYSNVAKEASTARLFWQKLTVGAFSSLILVVVVFLLLLPALGRGPSLDWPAVASRVVVSLAIGLLAAYSAREADRCLQIETVNRRLALELAALGPYLSTLPAEKQEEFRLKLGERMFGREDLSFTGDRAQTTIVDLLARRGVSAAIDSVSKLVEAVKK